MSQRLKALTRPVLEPGGNETRPYVALEHVEAGTGRLVPDVDLPMRAGAEPGYVAVEPSDLLFGRLRPYLAKTWSVDRPAYASTELVALRPTDQVEPRWLGYVISSKPFVDWSIATSEGSKMPRTSWEKLAEYRLPVVPDRRVQSEIADILDREIARLDALTEAKRRLIKLVAERPWVELLDQIGETGAPWTPLRRTLKFLTDGPFGSAFTSADYCEEGAVAVRLGNIGFAEYRARDEARIPLDLFRTLLRHRVLPGDLLIAGLGDANNHAGRACVAPDLGEAIVKGKCFCGRVDANVADASYLALVLSSSLGAEALGTGARGSTRSMINLEVVKNATIPLPPLDVQRRIVTRIQATRASSTALISRLDRQLELLVEHRQALITAAVTGRTEVHGVAT